MKLLELRQIVVALERDVVHVSLGDLRTRWGYLSAGEIEVALRVAGNHAAIAEGIQREERGELKRLSPSLDKRPFSPEARQHENPRLGPRWMVRIEGPKADLVAWYIENAVVHIEGHTALELSRLIRKARREARRYAGDSSTVLRVTGLLSDRNELVRLNAR